MCFTFEEDEKRHTLRMVKTSFRQIELLRNSFLVNLYYLKKINACIAKLNFDRDL